jgi:hypothetical protein
MCAVAKNDPVEKSSRINKRRLFMLTTRQLYTTRPEVQEAVEIAAQRAEHILNIVIPAALIQFGKPEMFLPGNISELVLLSVVSRWQPFGKPLPDVIQGMMFTLTLSHIYEALDEYLDFDAESPLSPFKFQVSYQPSESKKDFLNRVKREATNEYTNAMGSAISEQKIEYWIQKYFEGKTQRQITETMPGGGAENEEHVKTARQAYSVAIGHSLKRGQKELKSVLIKIDEFYEWWTTNKPDRLPPEEHWSMFLLGAIRTDIAPWPKEGAIETLRREREDQEAIL